MAQKSEIQWTDMTVNPTEGCLGCELWNERNRTCYAAKQTHYYNGVKLDDDPDHFAKIFGPKPGRMASYAAEESRLGTVRLDKPWLDGQPLIIFVSDMSDALSDHRKVSFEYLESEIIAAIESPEGRRHLWLWLTKRPGTMADFSQWLAGMAIPWPRNLWAGTSITRTATLGRIRDLERVGDEHTGRFLSVEPPFEDIDFSGHLDRVDWLIHGGASNNRQHHFDLAWARRTRDQCTAAGVPYFLKQLGTHAYEAGQRLHLTHPHGGEWSEWPQDLRVRETPDFARWLPAPTPAISGPVPLPVLN